jgi:hypothetical protein
MAVLCASTLCSAELSSSSISSVMAESMAASPSERMLDAERDDWGNSL